VPIGCGEQQEDDGIGMWGGPVKESEVDMQEVELS